jgi:ferric uptake regulator family protein
MMRGSRNISMNVRNTKQRQAIFEAIENHDGHLTADEIYRLVKRRFPRLSLGTVYRNLRVRDGRYLLRDRQEFALPFDLPCLREHSRRRHSGRARLAFGRGAGQQSGWVSDRRASARFHRRLRRLSVEATEEQQEPAPDQIALNFGEALLRSFIHRSRLSKTTR